MLIYKILRDAEWQQFDKAGVTQGAPVDLADGFIHFSAAEQVEGTLSKHFEGEVDLWLIACETDDLGSALVWEVSRGGAEFPHLYRTLTRADIVWARPLQGRDLPELT